MKRIKVLIFILLICSCNVEEESSEGLIFQNIGLSVWKSTSESVKLEISAFCYSETYFSNSADLSNEALNLLQGMSVTYPTTDCPSEKCNYKITVKDSTNGDIQFQGNEGACKGRPGVNYIDQTQFNDLRALLNLAP